MDWLIPSTYLLLAAAVFLFVISGTIIYALFSPEHRGRIIGFLLESTADGKGKPSLSRLQMLIWNIVVAFGFLYVLANVKPDDYASADATTPSTLANALDALFSLQILALLGVSNGTYLLGKRTRQAGKPNDSSSAPGDVGKAVEKISTDPNPSPTGSAPMG